jgi:UDP-3-O-[3-hydroxymyristoyl] glucosamine N-acyltransferase
MTKYNFFDNYGPFSLKELAKISNSTIYKPEGYTGVLYEESLLNDVAAIDKANNSNVVVLHNKKYLEQLNSSNAGVCIIDEKYIPYAPKTMMLLVNHNPYKAYATIASAFYPDEVISEYISPQAAIHKTAIIGKGCHIEPGAQIGQEVVIGENCKIAANAVISIGVHIGKNCKIGPLVSISHAVLGENVIIHSGAKIGQDGFGFASDQQGHYKVPQLGKVVIGNNVEIGANTCIDRGSSHDTVIGDYCMIDNLVQIAHNVELGKGCVVVAQVGISGSTKIGDFVVIGGQAGIAGHLNIGSGVQLAARTGVTRDIEPKEIHGGFPSCPIREWHRQTAAIKKLTQK